MTTEIMHDGSSMLVVDTDTGEVLREYVTTPYDPSNHKAIPQENYYTGLKDPEMLRDWCLENGYKASQHLFYDRNGINYTLGKDATRFKQMSLGLEYINYVFTTNRELQELWGVSRKGVVEILKKWVEMGVINYSTLNLSSRSSVRIEIHPQLICRGKNNVPERLHNFLQRNEKAKELTLQGTVENLYDRRLLGSMVNINRAITNAEAIQKGFSEYTDWEDREPKEQCEIIQSGMNRLNKLLAKDSNEWDLMLDYMDGPEPEL